MIRPAAASIVALLLVAPAPVRAQLRDRVSLGSGDAAVYDLVGAVRVVAATGTEVTADVLREGADAAKLLVQSGDVGGRRTLRVLFPGDRIAWPGSDGESRTRLWVQEDGTFGEWNDHRHAGREVTIERGRGLDARATVTLAVPTGRRVAVHVGVGDVTVTNVDGELTVQAHAATVTTTGTRGSLTLDTGSGAVKVSDAQGSLKLDSGSGDVIVRGLKGDRLAVDAGSGHLTADAVDVAEARLDLGSGGATMTAVRTQTLKVDAGSGDVSVDLLGDARTLDVDSGSGTVTLRVPPAFGAQLEIDAGSGGYRVDFPVTMTRQSRSHLTGSVGDGRGRVRIDSGSGEVRILRGA